MLLSITAGNNTYQIDVSLHSDSDKEFFCLAVLLPENSVLIAKKEFPGGEWHHIEGGEFAADLENAIYNEKNAQFHKQKIVDYGQRFKGTL